MTNKVSVNKKDIVELLFSGGHAESKAGAERLFNAVVDALRSSLVSVGDNGRVQVSGLGVLAVKVRPARTARNPKTGESIEVPEKRTVSFRPSKSLKTLVTSGEEPAPKPRKKRAKKTEGAETTEVTTTTKTRKKTKKVKSK